MQKRQPSLFGRDDTFFGVCEAIGEDFGFDPLYLRLALAVGLLWSPHAVVGAYAGLAVIVLVSRLIAPDPRRSRPRQRPATPKVRTAADAALELSEPVEGARQRLAA